MQVVAAQPTRPASRACNAAPRAACIFPAGGAVTRRSIMVAAMDMTPRTACLVIGGAGNLGSHVVRQLLERDHTVATFDLAEYSGANKESVQSFTGDVTDVDALKAAMTGIRVVFHCASLIDIRPVPSLKMRHVNVEGTVAVIAAAKACKVATLIYTASLEVVSGTDVNGVSRLLDGVDESCPIPARHHLPYASSKAYAERLVLSADCAELRTCSIRPGYIMGAGCIGLRVEMIKAAQRSGYYVTARVPATISTVHPQNCALMHVMAAEQISKEGVHGAAFFCRDFEDNVVAMALEAFQGTPIKPLLLPLTFAYFMAWILDRLERWLIWLYALFGATRVTSEEVIDITAVGMAYINIIVSDKRAKDVLGYKPVLDRAACMQEAARWCQSFYAKQTGGASK